MRKWEDIVKDKLEETENSLPESVFTEFLTRLDGVETTSQGKQFLGWVIAATAIAAGLAAVLFLRQPATTEDGIQIVQQTSVPVVLAPESNVKADSLQNEPLITQPITPNQVRSWSLIDYSQVTESCEIEEKTEGAVANPVEKTEKQEDVDPVLAVLQEETVTDEPIPSTRSPFLLDNIINKPIRMRSGTSSSLIMGSGLVAAIIPPIFVKTETRVAGEPLTNVPGETRTHYLPMRVGFSTSFSISDRLNLTTGLEYLLFTSRFSNDSSKGTKQFVHYLGIPVRLDWTLVSHNGLDLYVGGGIAGDYCLAASLGGNQIEKDGLGVSLLGASGIQYHITNSVGIYVEPELSWTIPSESRKLDTYCSEHPIMFTFATGIRLNIRK